MKQLEADGNTAVAELSTVKKERKAHLMCGRVDKNTYKKLPQNKCMGALPVQ